MSWRDKHRKATQLLAEIKAANARGVHDGPEAGELHIKLAEAQRLGDEVRSERLDELVRRADANVSNSGAGLTKSFGNGGAMISTEGVNGSQQDAARTRGGWTSSCP